MREDQPTRENFSPHLIQYSKVFAKVMPFMIKLLKNQKLKTKTQQF